MNDRKFRRLQKTLFDADLTPDHITKLLVILQSKQHEHNQEEFNKLLAEAKQRKIPEEWLFRAVKYFDDAIEEGDYTREELLDYPAFLHECVSETSSENHQPMFFFPVLESEVNCINYDCWYENNSDRVEEHEENYYNAADTKIVYCDICIDRLESILDKWGMNEILYKEDELLADQLKEYLMENNESWEDRVEKERAKLTNSPPKDLKLTPLDGFAGKMRQSFINTFYTDE